MSEPQAYPVYFNSEALDDEQLKKIHNHFKIRRKSGGGECSTITNVSDKVYRVDFKDEEAQQRVLTKREHRVEIAGVTLVLTVRDTVRDTARSSAGSSAGSSAAPPFTAPGASPTQEASSASPLHHSSSFPSLPSSGEKYEVPLESYLLHYLKECKQASTELDRELQSLQSLAKLCPETGQAFVRSLVSFKDLEQASAWKKGVDILFKKIKKQYHCHFEFDAKFITLLLKSCKVCEGSDDVKVYSESRMAVVVGEISDVNARLEHVAESHAKVRGASLGRKHSSVRRLGEAKLRLLWRELKLSLAKDFPDLQVTQGEGGQLVLNGTVEEIHKANDLISEKEKMVRDKTVADMSPRLLAFLMKAYNDPEMLSDFLGCGENVEIELKVTEIRLYSLSASDIEQTVKALKDKFIELPMEVPNSSEVPAELQESLKSKARSMNENGHKVQVSFTGRTVSLLGHAKEVNELGDAVNEFILDQANIEDRVSVPFPELAPQLAELLMLHGFDFAGVQFHPSRSSSKVALEGPSNAVTQVKSKLGPFLQSLVKDSISVNIPGALRYFKSPSGGEKLLIVASSHRCLVQVEDKSPASSLDEEEIMASYSLKNGLQVLVCLGDITKQEVDALVNAANENLKHGGGVALALSEAGGPEVQKESTDLVKSIGKISTGNVVVTTGGRLRCKKLLHAVGPEKHKAGGRERILLEETVESALVLAESMEFRSIAFPCISSGVFGVPIDVCTEAIVSAIRAFGAVGGRSLNKITLIDNRREVVQSMRAACDRLLQDITSGNTEDTDGAGSLESETGAAAGGSGGSVRVEIIQGTIETQQADCLVCPMLGHAPASVVVGQALLSMAGQALAIKFNQVAGGATLPGATVLVEGRTGLLSNAVLFINLINYTSALQNQAKQVLQQGIHSILSTCETKGFSSVAFPVMGPGGVLQFPHSVAAQILLQEIQAFEQNRAGRTPFHIRIVIHPSDKESSKAFQAAQQTVHLRGFTNDANPNHVSFYRHVSSANNEVTALMGSVRLQIVHGDITHEKTDVIVNSTGFQVEHLGVSKAILTAAGPVVQAELRQVGEPKDLMCTTGAGLLGCNKIIHSSFKKEPQAMSKTCKNILKLCENKGYSSAAFPAINTGIGAMDYGTACKAMLDGMAAAITELNPKCLSLIRIVIMQQPIFSAFRSELENRLGQIAPSQNLTGKLKKFIKKSRSSRSGANIPPTKPEPAVLSVIAHSSDAIKALKKALEGLVQGQLLEREFDLKELGRLDEMEAEAVRAKARSLGVSLDHSVRPIAEGTTTNSETRGRSNSRDKIVVLRGLKEDVLSVAELINKAIKKALSEDLQEQKEEVLAKSVQWFIQNQHEEWQHFPPHENYVLEEAHKKKEVFVEIEAPNGVKVQINLTASVATDCTTGSTYIVKRCETDTDTELPEYWTPMAGESFIKVEVDPNSKEYQDIAQGFKKTARFNIHKIERVQNYYLWCSYSVMKQRMLTKNGPAELGEKYLYHGTSAESCHCIERDRFDRNYAGTHAAAYGKGVYFAINASYSANNTYSPPDSLGFKRLYVARVLTGRYTVGHSRMVAPPPRGSDPSDKYDSVVDNQHNPSMFVIFHDDQAYPEYLITFS